MFFIFPLIIHNLYFSYLSIFQYYTIFKNPSFSVGIIYKTKSPSANAKGLEIDKLPGQDDYKTFCMNEEAGKVYRKLEEVINT